MPEAMVAPPAEQGRRRTRPDPCVKTIRELGAVLLTEIVPDPTQPRIHFPLSAQKKLRASIESVGQTDAIKVVLSPPGAETPYMIHDGERRYRVLKAMGRSQVTATLVEVVGTATEKQVLQAVANCCREPHNWLELASTMRKAAEELGRTNPQIGSMFGCTALWVYMNLRCIRMNPEAIALVDPGDEESPLMKMTLVYELARLPDKGNEHVTAFREALKHRWTINGAKRYVAARLAVVQPLNERKKKPADNYRALVRTIETVRDRSGLGVSIGRLTIGTALKSRRNDEAQELVDGINQTIRQLEELRGFIAEAKAVKVA